MINRVTLLGNLGKDPEIRRLENGAVVAKFSVATNENYRDKNGEWQKLTEWHDIVAWRSLAERAESTLKKGTMIYIEGKLTHRTWQDQEGNNRRTTEVVANYFRTISPRREDDSSDNGNRSFSEADEPSYSTRSNDNPAASSSVEVNEIADDDLPF